LAIVVQPTGHMAWYCIYSYHGRPRWLYLAEGSAIGLASARKLGAETMYQVAQGKDPAAERRAERGADTFGDLAARYLEYSKRKNKSWRQAERLVRKYLLPRWSKLPAADIGRSDVRVTIASVDAPVLANQILASASAIFGWAIKHDVARIKTNPCRGIERNTTSSRERVLSDSEIPLFWSAFDDEGKVGAALRVILLTGQRPGEVAHMRSEHIIDGWWTMPGEPVSALKWPGTKNAASHRVWLSSQVQQIIGDAQRAVFDVSNEQLAKAMRTICSRIGVERVTPHDLRRTNGTMITSLGFGRDAMNRIQNHKEGGIASVYDRHQYSDEIRKIMETVSRKN
jgi:integrase